MEMEGEWNLQQGLDYDYQYNGKELASDLGLDWLDYGARFYDASIGRFTSVDPLASEFPSWTPYHYVHNNPLRYTDPTGMSADDIILRGSNNSSVIVKTDLVDIDINAGSIVGDIGGNYSFEGDDILVAGLDIAGVLDPTGVADVAAASIEAKNGNYGSALLSGLGVIPYVGDVAKVGKIGKHTKTIKNAISAVHGNSKASQKAQHLYEVFETGTGNVVKTGVSGGKVSKSGKSYRATSQVNKWNKAEGAGKYYSRITQQAPAGPGARQKILNAEKANASRLQQQGQLRDPKKHVRPRN
jgi:RHS repeat-associated protein